MSVKHYLRAVLVTAVFCGCAPSPIRAQHGGTSGPPVAPPPLEDRGEWVPAAPLLVPRQEVGVATLNGKVYVLGGMQGGVRLSSMEVYDPEANQWTFATGLPKPALDHVGLVAVQGKLYAIGGLGTGGAVAALFEYDPASDRWTRKADMPTPRGAAGVAAIGSRIYVAGGYFNRNSVADFACYDVATGKWQKLPPMPTPRDHLVGVALNGRFHAIGGQRLVSRNGPVLGVHEVFDPATGKWSLLAALPTPRAGMGAGTLRRRIQVFGGEGNDRRPEGTFSENEEYDPGTDSWSALAPMPLPRHGTQGAVIGDLLYVPGGGPREGFSETAAVDIFRYRRRPPGSPALNFSQIQQPRLRERDRTPEPPPFSSPKRRPKLTPF